MVDRASLALTVTVALAAGCWSHERYLVDARELDRARLLPLEERERAIVDARREESGRRAYVRFAALRFDPAKPAAQGAVSVPSHAFNRMATAGSLLTWVGSAISVAGTIVFAVHHGDFGTLGGVTGASVALAAEPIMLTGTLLWILSGTTHRPEEVRAPPPDQPPAGDGGPAASPTR
jgi:hypothetical protein